MRRSGFKRNKFGAIATYVDGIKWPSQLQAGHYGELKLLEAGKIIQGLDWEIDFPLKIEGKLICTYRADFTCFHIGRNRNLVIESKGKETDVFRIKLKLFRILYPEWDIEVIKKKSVYDIINAEQ